jgi:hypothetical protein
MRARIERSVVPGRLASVVLVFLALLVVACTSKREARPKPQPSAAPSAMPATFKPSAESGILLPTSKEMTATWKGKRVILEHFRVSGGCFSGPIHSRGIYVTEDGLVFSFQYKLPEDVNEIAEPCDIRDLRDGSPEQDECFHHASTLRAKLEPSLLGALELDLARVVESERVELLRGGAGHGDSVLAVPGRGYKGSSLEIAWCRLGNGSQLLSPEARWIFTVFRRIRRASGRGWGGTDDNCPSSMGLKKEEIAPGVPAWWSYEE